MVNFKLSRSINRRFINRKDTLMSKIALITGITGQDGAHLARFLLDKGYIVHGMRPYAATNDQERTNHINGLHLHYGDLTDSGNLLRLIENTQPNEIYNLGAMTHVGVSFDSPEATTAINAVGTLKLLEAIRLLDAEKNIRFYQASSSEMFGNAPAPQNENTPFCPCSPYGNAKLHAYWSTRIYRESYGLFASNGILFNHESPLRGEEFVTRKICRAVAAIHRGEQDVLTLGNLDAMRDWGHAGDYVRGMWMMLQHDTADDFVLATGETKTVREFVTRAFNVIDIDITWKGKDREETGIDSKSGKVLITIAPTLYRPTDINCLIGDYGKAKSILGWEPEMTFPQLVEEMMRAELNL